MSSQSDRGLFPANFMWGTASAAYQIEGAWDADGKSPSIWDDFCHRPNSSVIDQDTGDVAVDHYHRYAEDIELMQSLNINAYRFSIAWTRVMPEGRGQVNPKGLAFYDALVDKQLECGITPMATLVHWDIPVVLQQQGGWANRELAYWFADYVDVVVKALGDRVQYWNTVNEPSMHASLGYLTGEHAPGIQSPKQFCHAVHHQLLGHGLAMQVIRAAGSQHKAGIALHLSPTHPFNPDKKKDRWAAYFANAMTNCIFLDPLYKKKYPEIIRQRLRWFMPKVTQADMDIIATPTDFLGANNYTSYRFSHTYLKPFFNIKSHTGTVMPDCEYEKDGQQYTAMGWLVDPDSLYDILKMVQQDYDNPTVYITENGAAYTDELIDGKINDEKRIEYYEMQLDKVSQAMSEGADIRGYFAWSFTDNFEWTEGYRKRFGLVYVDYGTQRRIPKQSAKWYADLIKAA